LTGEGPLGLLDLTLQFTESAKVLADISASFFLVALDEVVNDAVIKIFTTKMGVTSSSQNLEDTIVNGKERDIKGSTTKIIDNNLRFAAFLVKAVGDSGGSRLVDDAEDSKTGNGSGVLGCLTLSVVEIYRLPE